MRRPEQLRVAKDSIGTYIVPVPGVSPPACDKGKVTMLGTMEVMPTAGKRDVRKELRLHRKDEERIKAAAKAAGLGETDFIIRASLQKAEDVERHRYVSVLPAGAFAAFKEAVEAPPRELPGLARLVEEAKGILKDG